MIRDELIAQLQKDLAADCASLAFWEAQPDSQVPGFSVVEYREKLSADIAKLQAILAKLKVMRNAAGPKGQKRPDQLMARLLVKKSEMKPEDVTALCSAAQAELSGEPVARRWD
jgi:hypothetical protein